MRGKLIVTLTAEERRALKWAAQKADEWFGNITGDRASEVAHLQRMDKVQDALFKLGIKLSKRWHQNADGRNYMLRNYGGRR